LARTLVKDVKTVFADVEKALQAYGSASADGSHPPPPSASASSSVSL